MSRKAVSADIIPNSAVCAPPAQGLPEYSTKIQLYATTAVQTGFNWLLYSESVATLPPFSPIEGQKWFDKISSQWESQKNRLALIYFGKIQFLPPCIWNLPFMTTASARVVSVITNPRNYA